MPSLRVLASGARRFGSIHLAPGWPSRLWEAAARNPRAAEAFADQAVVSVTNFATGVIIGRSCPPEQFGLYALAFVVISGLIDLQATLISAPYTVYRPRLDDESARVYTGATLLFQAAFSLLTLVVLVAAAGALHTGSGGLSPVLTALGLTVAFVLAKENLRRLFFAGLRMRKALVLDLVVAVVQLGSLVVLARSGRMSATTAIVTVGLVSGAVAGAWLLMHRHEYTFSGRRAVNSLLAMWRLGRWMSASGILWNITTQLYPWLLATLRGSAATALWAACGSITSVVNPAVLALNNYMAPAAAAAYATGGAAGLRRVVLHLSAFFVAAVLPFCLLMLVAGAHIVTFVYGSAYGHDGLVVSLLALNLIPLGVSLVASRGLFALERADLDFQINLVPFAVMLAGGFWLIGAHGVAGAAAATLAGTSAGAVLRLLAFLALSHEGRQATQGAGQPAREPARADDRAEATGGPVPLVSVVLPVFNGERFVRGAIESVLTQHHPRVEVIVVDDGSTDRTPQILREFGPAIRVLRQANGGRSVARNRGLEEAAGKFVVFLDADDLLTPEHVSTLVAACESGPYDLAYCRAEAFLHRDPAARLRVFHRYPDEDRAVGIILDDFIPINAAVVRAAFLRQAALRFRSGLRCGEDWEFWIRLVLANARVKFVDRVLALNREHDQNTKRDLVGMDEGLPDLLAAIEAEHRDVVRRRALEGLFARSRTRIRFRMASVRVFLGARAEGRRALLALAGELPTLRAIDRVRYPVVFLLSLLPLQLPMVATRFVFGQNCALAQRLGRSLLGPEASPAEREGRSGRGRGPEWGHAESA